MNNEQARPTSRRHQVQPPVKRITGNISQGKGGEERAQGDSLPAALLVLVLLIILFVKGCSGSDPLTGTWDYDSNTTYQFDGKESGAMILTSATYDFSYQVKDDQLFIDFSNEAARDCTYTFSVNGNTLTLTGGEGSIGGTYELHRQEE